MSYEIFTKISYNKKTGAFDCVSCSNNVWPRTPSAWTMDYYLKKYPDATEQEHKAALILQGLYNGDQYPGAKWARDYQKIARVWYSEQGGGLVNINYHSIKTARALAAYYAEYKAQPVKHFYIVNTQGDYIVKINKATYRTGSRRIAKVFEARTQREILLIDGVKWLVEKAGFQIFKAE